MPMLKEKTYEKPYCHCHNMKSRSYPSRLFKEKISRRILRRYSNQKSELNFRFVCWLADTTLLPPHSARCSLTILTKSQGFFHYCLKRLF